MECPAPEWSWEIKMQGKKVAGCVADTTVVDNVGIHFHNNYFCRLSFLLCCCSSCGQSLLAWFFFFFLCIFHFLYFNISSRLPHVPATQMLTELTSKVYMSSKASKISFNNCLALVIQLCAVPSNPTNSACQCLQKYQQCSILSDFGLLLGFGFYFWFVFPMRGFFSKWREEQGKEHVI